MPESPATSWLQTLSVEQGTSEEGLTPPSSAWQRDPDPAQGTQGNAEFIMGEPWELGTLQEYISPSEKSITFDGFGESFPVPARLSEVYYSHCILIP